MDFQAVLDQFTNFWAAYPAVIVAIGALFGVIFVLLLGGSLLRRKNLTKRFVAIETTTAADKVAYLQQLSEVGTKLKALNDSVTAATNNLERKATGFTEASMKFEAASGRVAKELEDTQAVIGRVSAEQSEQHQLALEKLQQATAAAADEARKAFDKQAGTLLSSTEAQRQAVADQAAALRHDLMERLGQIGNFAELETRVNKLQETLGILLEKFGTANSPQPNQVETPVPASRHAPTSPRPSTTSIAGSKLV